MVLIVLINLLKLLEIKKHQIKKEINSEKYMIIIIVNIITISAIMKVIVILILIIPII